MNDPGGNLYVTNGGGGAGAARETLEDVGQCTDHLSDILPSRTCGIADREKINEIRNEIVTGSR